MLRPETRWGACGIHLGITLVIFLVPVWMILFRWFPGALFSAAGGCDGIKIVVGVGLVLGPMLTLIVYTGTKPRRLLVMDLSIIAALQVSSLAVGAYIVHGARPLAAVFVFDTFYTLNREDYTSSDIDPAVLDRFPGPYPKLVYVETPKDIGDFLGQHTKSLIMGETPLEKRIDRYESLPRDPEQMAELLNAPINDEKGCIRVDLETPYTSGTVCYHPQSGRFSDFKKDTP